MTKQKMTSNERNNLIKYVVPAALANTCFFLFSVVDGIFVGRGVGTQALGAVNLALPFVLIAEALNSLVTIGGVTIVAIRLGRGDKEGAESAFMHSFLVILLVGALITIGGTCLTRPAVRLLGARESYAALVEEYLFWWAIFGIPSSLNVNLMGFCRNDGSSGRVAVGTGVATVLNIILDWLFVFPLKMGLMGAAVATGISQTVSLCIILSHFLMKQGSLCFQRVPVSLKLFRKIAFPRVARGYRTNFASGYNPMHQLCVVGRVRRYRNQCLFRNLLCFLIYPGNLLWSFGRFTAFIWAILWGKRGKRFKILSPSRYLYQCSGQFDMLCRISFPGIALMQAVRCRP